MFYDRDPEVVARELLGHLLVHETSAGPAAGWIVETEAYLHAVDPASHSYVKQTKRNRSMFGPPGHAYVYAIHSRWCFNVVTEPEAIASAVLIRALEPAMGLDLMQQRRRTEKLHDLTRGPGRLCEALAIGKQHDGHDLTKSNTLFITQKMRRAIVPSAIVTSTRIGITKGAEMPLRFFVQGSRFVSGKRG